MERQDTPLTEGFRVGAASERSKELDEARERHIKQLLESEKQVDTQESLNTTKWDHIPNYIYVRPLHPDPDQHIERLSIVLMFRTRFLALPTYERDMYTYQGESFPLVERYGLKFLERSCGIYGINHAKLQPLVDELWREKIFSPSSSVVQDLQIYTDEDLVSDKFRNAVGLPVLGKKTVTDDEKQLARLRELRRLSRASVSNELESQKLLELARQCAAFSKAKKPTNNAGSEVLYHHGRRSPPKKSRFMTMISSTSLHGGKKNIYNPSPLRRPSLPLALKEKQTSSQPTHPGNRPRSKSVSLGSSNTDTSNRGVFIDESWEKFCQSQREENSSGIKSGFGVTTSGGHRVNTMNSGPLGVAPSSSSAGEPMDIDNSMPQRRLSTQPLRTQGSIGSGNATFGPPEPKFEDAMDIDDPTHRRMPRNPVPSSSALRSRAASTSSNRRDSMDKQPPSVISVMNAMKTKHAEVVKNLRRSRRSSPAPQDMTTSLEDLDICKS